MVLDGMQRLPEKLQRINGKMEEYKKQPTKCTKKNGTPSAFKPSNLS
jgi:hypothetical protein